MIPLSILLQFINPSHLFVKLFSTINKFIIMLKKSLFFIIATYLSVQAYAQPTDPPLLPTYTYESGFERGLIDGADFLTEFFITHPDAGVACIPSNPSGVSIDIGATTLVCSYSVNQAIYDVFNSYEYQVRINFLFSARQNPPGSTTTEWWNGVIDGLHNYLMNGNNYPQ